MWSTAIGLSFGQRQDVEAQQRALIRSVAHADARLAIKVVTDPFFVLFGDSNEGSETELIPAHALDTQSLAAVGRIDVRSAWQDSPPVTPGEDLSLRTSGWWTILKEHADRGAARIDRVLQIYSTYLDADTIRLLSRLRSTEFLIMRLQLIDEFVASNRHVHFLPFPFPGRQLGEHSPYDYGYQEFWSIVRDLDRTLERDPARLKRRL